MPSRLHLEIFGPIHALPILHYRLEFADLVRQAVRQVRPDCIAVELPSTLEERFIQAVDRLPQVSVISYESTPSPSSKTAAPKPSICWWNRPTLWRRLPVAPWNRQSRSTWWMLTWTTTRL